MTAFNSLVCEKWASIRLMRPVLRLSNHSMPATCHRAWQSALSEQQLVQRWLSSSKRPHLHKRGPARTRAFPLPARPCSSREWDCSGLGSPVSSVWKPSNVTKELRCGQAQWNFQGIDNLLCGNKSCHQVTTKPI